MSFLRHLGFLAAAACGAAILVGACGEEEQETLCDPGSEIFCRCPGGEAGTKTCQNDGSSFGDCFVDPVTMCGERVDCIEGDTVVCACPSGDIGEKACLRDGDGYGECEIAPDVPCPADPSSTTTSGPGGGGVGGMGEGGGPVASCSHDVCETGDALDTSCGECALAVCTFDNYCCETEWDLTCISEADQECDNICNPINECAHDPCVSGAALDSECSPCVTAICTADDFCCTDEWDTMCVSKANMPSMFPACSGLCGCAHDECVTGEKLDAACSDCATAVCELDNYCCNNQWDSFCVTKAEDNLACDCF